MVSRYVSVAVVVSDGKKARKWYTETLGLESKEEGHWITVWPKGSNLRIHLCETKDKLEPGNTGIAFFARNIKVEARKLKEKGVNFTKEVVDEGWGKHAMFSDPDGNIFWLIEGTP